MMSGINGGCYFSAGYTFEYNGVDDHGDCYDDEDDHNHDGMLSGVTTGCNFPTHCRLLLGVQHQAFLSG